MTTETMNIRSAQDEKKMLDKKIEKAFEAFMPMASVVAHNPFVGSLTSEEYAAKVVADYQSINDLIKRREAIVKAIMDANIENKVKVRKFAGIDSLSKPATELTEDDYEMITIANAIARKKYFESTFSNKLDLVGRRVNAVIKEFKSLKEQVAGHVDKLVNDRFAGVQNVSQDARAKAVATETERYEVSIIDPLKSQTLMVTAADAVLDYIKDLNNSLSRITEVTEITITY